MTRFHALTWSVAALSLLSIPMSASAQEITITPPTEVAAFMSACTPVDAVGPAIRDGLIERGWAAFTAEERSGSVRSLGAAYLWYFFPNRLDEERIADLDYVADGLSGAADGETASLLGFDDQIALILWNGDNLSCLWAGPEGTGVQQLASHLGGFIESDGVTTRSVNQTVEAGGREWARRMSVAHTPVANLPTAVADRAITDAARLDRSPQ